MQVPHTYAQWAKVLDNLKKGIDDGDTLAVMQQGTLEWQSGVAERFSRRLTDAVNSRMNALIDRCDRNFRNAGGNETLIVQALLTMRKEFQFLMQVMSIPAIPQAERIKYQNLVKTQADQVQSSLEDSAWNDRTGKMSNIVRNSRVNVF